jgi:hypothetical protein
VDLSAYLVPMQPSTVEQPVPGETQFGNNQVTAAELDLGRPGHNSVEIQRLSVPRPQEILGSSATIRTR